MKDIMERALEAQRAGLVLDASVFGGFPMADIPYVGFTVVIVAADNLPAAERLRNDLMRMAWERRQDFVYEVEPVADSMARAKRLEGGPIVLVDHGDNVFSGGTQDVMETVAEALRQGLTDMAVGPIWDPESVMQMVRAGVGNRVTLQLGGKTDMPALGLKGRTIQDRGQGPSHHRRPLQGDLSHGHRTDAEPWVKCCPGYRWGRDTRLLGANGAL